MFFRLAIECALSVRIKFTLISKTEKDEAMNKKQCRTCFTQYTVCRRAERKTGAANESRRTELKAPGELGVQRSRFPREHACGLCRTYLFMTYSSRQSGIFFRMGGSAFYPYGYVFGGISCRDSPSMKESPMRQRLPLSRCGECVCPWCSGCNRRFPEACVRGRSIRVHFRSPR